MAKFVKAFLIIFFQHKIVKKAKKNIELRNLAKKRAVTNFWIMM